MARKFLIYEKLEPSARQVYLHYLQLSSLKLQSFDLDKPAGVCRLVLTVLNLCLFVSPASHRRLVNQSTDINSLTMTELVRPYCSNSVSPTGHWRGWESPAWRLLRTAERRAERGNEIKSVFD